MSTRQNKKRKGRGNALNRERTVTTLTEGPEAPFLSASPADDVPHLNLMSSPFSVASSAAGALNPALSPAFSMSPSFPSFPYNYHPAMPGPPFAPQQSMYNPQPGQNDLEILERLKETIKNNQHEFFHPVPRPAALASIYLGPRGVPPHPEQIPQSASDDRRQVAAEPVAAESKVSAQNGLSKAVSSGGPNGGSNILKRLEPAIKTVTDSPGKFVDMDPPGLNTPLSAVEPGIVKLESDTMGNNISRPSAIGQSQVLGRSATEKSLTSEPGYAPRGPNDQSPSKFTSWPPRDSGSSQEDIKSKTEDDRFSTIGRSNTELRSGNFDNNRWQRPYRDYDRDRERERDRERDFDRDRERDRRGPDGASRLNRDERRPDEKLRYSDRRPALEQRHHEPRYERNGEPPRRWDSKNSVDSATSTVTRPDDRPPRPSTEDRSFESRALRPIPEERSLVSRPPPANERDPPPRLPEDRLTKQGSADDRPPPLERSTRAIDDRRLPSLTGDRQGKAPAADERRSTNPQPVAGSDSGLDRSVKPPAATNERRPPPPSPAARAIGTPLNAGDRGISRVADDRRPPPPGPLLSGDRARVSTDDRRPPVPSPVADRARDDYNSARPAPTTASEASTPRAPPLERVRTLTDDRGPQRPPIPLEERITRPPSLQERISTRPGELSSPPKPEERAVRPPAANETRPPTTMNDDRTARLAPLVPEDRLSRPPPVSEPAPPARANDTRTAPIESARAPLLDRHARPDDRGRPPVSDRFATPSSDRNGDRSAPVPPPRYNYSSKRPLSLTRNDPSRTFNRAGTVSPRRGDYRPLERPPYPDRYEMDRPRDRRPDGMDIDSPPDRYDRPQNYRRNSPPPYGRTERAWPPPGEPYPADSARRPLPDSPQGPGYGRDWRDDERYDDWDRRTWDRDRPPPRDREYDRDRDGRLVDRDVAGLAPAPGWETREERERRVSGGFVPVDAPPPPGPNRYDSRPLSARLSDGYPPVEDRDRAYDRGRYPPLEPPPAGSYSRVRPRSPTPPPRRGVDDLRPPLKRTRDDAYGPGFYSPPPPSLDAPRDYPPPPPPPPPRGRTPPPVGGYYDDTRAGYVSPAGSVRERDRERDFVERDGYPGYGHDRREPLPMSRMSARSPPPPPPPPYGRGGYARDDRRYPLPPSRP